MTAQPQLVRRDSGIIVPADAVTEHPKPEAQAAAAARRITSSKRLPVRNEHGGFTSTVIAPIKPTRRDPRPKCRVCRKGRLEPSDDPMPDDHYGERKPNAQNLRCTSCRQLVRFTVSPRKA